MADDQFAEFRTPDEMASMSSETLSLRDRVVLDILTARAGGWQRGAEIDYDAVVDWPTGSPTSSSAASGGPVMTLPKFRATWARTMRDLEVMFRKWDVEEWDVQVGYRGRRTRDLSPSQRRVTVVWTDAEGHPRQLDCDVYESQDENLRPIYLALESVRLNAVRGVGDIVARAYLALAGGETAQKPHEVLGIKADATHVDVEHAYRRLAKSTHPDVGGDPDTFKEIVAARDAMLAN